VGCGKGGRGEWREGGGEEGTGGGRGLWGDGGEECQEGELQLELGPQGG